MAFQAHKLSAWGLSRHGPQVWWITQNVNFWVFVWWEICLSIQLVKPNICVSFPPPPAPFPLQSMTVVLETNFFTVAYILYSQAYDIPVNLEHYVQYYFKSELLFNESWG